MELKWPDETMLVSYVDAIERGWSPHTMVVDEGLRELASIRVDPPAFIRQLVDLDASGPDIPMPDGSFAPRLPGYRKWMWDGAFCGSIGFRWQPGTAALPSYVLGHIGYSVVPWKRRQGCATEALRLVLVDTCERGLPYIELTTDPDNIGSQRVIEANGGVVVERFRRDAAYGATDALRYRIHL
jgi:predicted acetyltransferase